MSRQMLMYLVRIPHRKGHSIQAVVLGGRGRTLAPPPASRVRLELAQTGGISSCVKQLGSNNRYRIFVCGVSFCNVMGGVKSVSSFP